MDQAGLALMFPALTIYKSSSGALQSPRKPQGMENHTGLLLDVSTSTSACWIPSLGDDPKLKLCKPDLQEASKSNPRTDRESWNCLGWKRPKSSSSSTPFHHPKSHPSHWTLPGLGVPPGIPKRGEGFAGCINVPLYRSWGEKAASFPNKNVSWAESSQQHLGVFSGISQLDAYTKLMCFLSVVFVFDISQSNCPQKS